MTGLNEVERACRATSDLIVITASAPAASWPMPGHGKWIVLVGSRVRATPQPSVGSIASRQRQELLFDVRRSFCCQPQKKSLDTTPQRHNCPAGRI